MRILVLNWRDPFHPWAGGAEVFLYELARRWVSDGHHVTWFSSRHPQQVKSQKESGIHFIRKGGFYSVFFQAPIYYLRTFSGKFDVILDSANGVPFFSPLYSATPKLVLVHHIHEQVFFRELPRHLAHLANLLERFATPFVYRNTQFITVSDSSRRALIQIGVANNQISLIFNGVDVERYQPGEKSKKPFVLFLGRLRHYKSVDIAINALPELLKSYPELQFGIVGSGPAKQDLENLANRLGVNDQIQFYGRVGEQEKIRLLQHAHVVLNPSMKEGWGLTVLEANACGTPVIGADVPGLRDSIRHGKTGLLVPYGEAKPLTDAVSDILSKNELRQDMEAQALTWARRFDWDSSAKKCLHLLYNAANGRAR